MADKQISRVAVRMFWQTFQDHKWHRVPKAIAECPECSKAIVVMSHAYDEETDQPIGSALQIECGDDESGQHRYWQSDWQPVVDAVRKWCGATND